MFKNNGRTFKEIITAAEKQQKQLDAARKAWAAAKNPSAKKLAQKAGEKAKVNLANLRQEWRKVAGSASAHPAAPIVPAASTPASSKAVSEQAKIKAKYAGLRKNLENKLESEYQEELAALKAKFVAKKKEELKALITCYEMEIASIGHETVVLPASVQKEEPVAPAPVPVAENTIEAPVYNGKKAVLIAGSIFKSGNGNCYAVNTQFNRVDYLNADPNGKQKMINAALKVGDIVKVEKQAENLLFPCDMYVKKEPQEEMITVEAEIIEEAAIPVIAELPVDNGDDNGLIYEGATIDFDGKKYRVIKSFDRDIFMISDKMEKQEMIFESVAAGDIELIVSDKSEKHAAA